MLWLEWATNILKQIFYIDSGQIFDEKTTIFWTGNTPFLKSNQISHHNLLIICQNDIWVICAVSHSSVDNIGLF